MKPRGFTWPTQLEKALEHQLVRAIHLERCNPDYQLKHPAEHKANPSCAVRATCHPEAKKRILTDHHKIIQLSIVPPVKRPERLNRVG